MFRELGVLVYHSQQRQRFLSGELWRDWADRYQEIFDEQDVELAHNQAPAPMGYHFFEWLAAILLYHTTGYLSLVEQYEFKIQKRKQVVLQKLVSPDLFELITDHCESYGSTQCPDLLVYAPDFSNWFFCEVKSPTDKLSEIQKRFFAALSEVSRKEIGIFRFQEAQPVRIR